MEKYYEINEHYRLKDVYWCGFNSEDFDADMEGLENPFKSIVPKHYDTKNKLYYTRGDYKYPININPNFWDRCDASVVYKNFDYGIKYDLRKLWYQECEFVNKQHNLDFSVYSKDIFTLVLLRGKEGWEGELARIYLTLPISFFEFIFLAKPKKQQKIAEFFQHLCEDAFGDFDSNDILSNEALLKKWLKLWLKSKTPEAFLSLLEQEYAN